MTVTSTRTPDAEDIVAISAIDAEGLGTGHASFRDTPHDWTSFASSYMTGHGLALVSEAGNGIVAWAGISPTSARAVYRGVGEVSIYVSASARGRGVGQSLLKALIERSEQAGYWTLVAQVFPENESSLSLHGVCGFDIVGTRKKLGQMSYGPFAGRWRDVVMLERRSRLFR